MKKTIIAVLLTVVVMAGLGYGMIYNINQEHATEIEELKSDYETQIEKLENEHHELEDNVYRMMTEEDYEITVHKGNVTHTWKSDDNKGLFKSENHSMIISRLNGLV